MIKFSESTKPGNKFMEKLKTQTAPQQYSKKKDSPQNQSFESLIDQIKEMTPQKQSKSLKSSSAEKILNQDKNYATPVKEYHQNIGKMFTASKFGQEYLHQKMKQERLEAIKK
ncbi:hypothetical protein pb186bvf_018238 [Paramecium bursaria]